MSRRTPEEVERILHGRSSNARDRRLLLIGAFLVAGSLVAIVSLLLLNSSGGSLFGSSKKPEVGEIDGIVREYLLSKAGDCPDGLYLENFSIDKIGEFNRRYGAWPVHASYTRVCKKGIYTGRYNSTSSPNAFTVMVKSGIGGFKTYRPAIFEQAEREMSRHFQKAFQ